MVSAEGRRSGRPLLVLAGIFLRRSTKAWTSGASGPPASPGAHSPPTPAPAPRRQQPRRPDSNATPAPARPWDWAPPPRSGAPRPTKRPSRMPGRPGSRRGAARRRCPWGPRSWCGRNPGRWSMDSSEAMPVMDTGRVCGTSARSAPSVITMRTSPAPWPHPPAGSGRSTAPAEAGLHATGT